MYYGIIVLEILVIIIKQNDEIYEYPNTIISIDGICIGYSKQMPNGLIYNAISSLIGDSFTNGKVSSPFSLLLDKIFYIIEHGRSVRYNPSIYITKSETYTVDRIPIRNDEK